MSFSRLVSISGAAAVLAACSSGKSGGFTPSDAGGDAQNLLACGHADCDGDGYVVPKDCNDNDAMINPEAFDFVGDGIDNDPLLTCETIPASPPGSPTDFARAADLCAQRAKTNAGTVFDPLVN